VDDTDGQTMRTAGKVPLAEGRQDYVNDRG
jgi:hypothetical protein